MGTLLKAVISGAIIGGVNVIAQRNPTLGGWLAALPLITVLSLFWLQLDGKPNQDLMSFVTGVLYGLVPTAAILVTLMFTLRAGLPLAVCLLLGVVVWAVVTLLARFLGIL